jgi:hypothetical protein
MIISILDLTKSIQITVFKIVLKERKNKIYEINKIVLEFSELLLKLYYYLVNEFIKP